METQFLLWALLLMALGGAQARSAPGRRALLQNGWNNDACPTSDQPLCVQPGAASLPANMNRLMNNAARLPLADFRNYSVNLLDVLPYGEMMESVLDSVPRAEFPCDNAPAAPGAQARGYATDDDRPVGELFEACERAPFPDNKYYMYGAYSRYDLWQLWDPSYLPALQALRRNYGGGVPSSACFAINPCTMDVFMAFKGVRKPVKVERAGWTVFFKAGEYFYSWAASVAPPAWRANDSTPVLWSLQQPNVAGSLGELVPLTKRTPKTGRMWINGSIPFGGFSLATARVELGSQKSAWMLLRDERRVAVSLHLAAPPSIKLWNTIWLPFRFVDGLKSADLTLRVPNSLLWLTVRGVSVNASLVAAEATQVGDVLARVFVNGRISKRIKVVGIDVHCGGSRGAAVRLQLTAPGGMRLTNEAAYAVGQPKAVAAKYYLIMHAAVGESAFSRVTLDLDGRPVPL